MHTLRNSVVTRALERSGGVRLAKHLAQEPRQQTFSRDSLEEAVRSYEALGSELTDAERRTLRNVFTVLGARPLFDLGDEARESLRDASHVTHERTKGPVKPRGAPAFSARSAPHVVDGRTPSGLTQPWRETNTCKGSGQPILTPDGERVLLSSSQGHLLCVNAKTGKEQWAVKPDPTYAYNSPAVSPDGATAVLATGYYNTTLHALDVATGEVRWSSPSYSGGTYQQSSPVFSADGKRVYLCCQDHRLRAFDAATGKECWANPPNVPAGSLPSAPTLSPDGQWLVMQQGDGQLLAFDAQTGEQKWTAQRDGDSYAVPVFSADGATVYATGGDRLYAFDAGTGEQKWSARPLQRDSANASPLPTPDGRYVVQAGHQGTLHVYSAEDGRTLRTFSNSNGSWDFVSSPAFNEATQTVVVVDANGRYSTLELSSDEPNDWSLRQVPTPDMFSQPVWGGFALSSDGEWAYTAYRDKPLLGIVRVGG